jgi:N-acetylneuraminic acid mutarotase
VHAGKSKTQFFNDLWSYDPQTKQWAEIQTSGTKPSARYAHTATLLADETVLLLGGKTPTGLPLPEAWKLNTDHTYTQLSNPPMGLSHHTAHRVNNEVYVFGEPNKTFVYDVTEDKWSTLPEGPPLWGYATSALGENKAGEKNIYIFGGIHKYEYESNVVYEFNTASKTISQRQEYMPFTHSSGSAATLLPQKDSQAIKILFFGGKSNNKIINTTFLFSPVSYEIGDVNHDGILDMKDVILSLKVVTCSTLTESLYKDVDVNGDIKIGNEEAVYLLQKVGGIRP